MKRESQLYLNLWACVLERAIEDLHYDPPQAPDAITGCRQSEVKRELYWKRQAQAWIRSERRDFNSFEGVCVILGLEPAEVRKKLYRKSLL
jgi:hypothetical protein